jgi:hypothetical protein
MTIKKSIKGKGSVKEEVEVPERQHYRVELDTLVPAVLTYKVLAETPEEALAMALKLRGPSSPPSINISKARRLKAKVFRFGTVQIDLVKNF